MKYISLLLVILIASYVICGDDDDFSSPKYQNMTRANKTSKIWKRVTEDLTPYGWYGILAQLQMFFEDVSVTLQYESDSFPPGRKKLLHSVGNVGLVEFIAEKDPKINPYTGIFKGSDHAILRFSLVQKPDETKVQSEGAVDNYSTGFGLKFLRNKVHSGNTLAMISPNGQASWNWFKYEISNHIPEPLGILPKIQFIKFGEATQFTTMIGLLDVAKYDQEGNEVEKPIFPYKITFRPSKEVSNLFPDFFNQTYTEQLKQIPKNIKLYDVLAMEKPSTEAVKIGSLYGRSKFVTSKWGDTSLFFRHDDMEHDFKIHPEWRPKEVGKNILKDPDFQRKFKAKYGFEHP